MKTSEFKSQFSGACTVGGVKVRGRLDPESGEVAVGWVTSKKLGNAVTRNRMRRRGRAVIRELIKTDSLTPGQYVISFNREMGFQELDKSLKTALRDLVK